MSPCLDRLQRGMPLLCSMPKHVWSYSSVIPLYAMVTREFFGARAMGSSYGANFFFRISEWAWERGWEGGFSRASGRII
jgi:hypothetical protein